VSRFGELRAERLPAADWVRGQTELLKGPPEGQADQAATDGPVEGLPTATHDARSPHTNMMAPCRDWRVATS